MFRRFGKLVSENTKCLKNLRPMIVRHQLIYRYPWKSLQSLRTRNKKKGNELKQGL